MRSAFGVEGFSRLWLAQALSSIGDWLLVVAVPLYVFEQTRSGAATAMSFAAEALPQALVAPLAGAAADRLRPAAVLVLTNAFAAAVVAGMLGVEAGGGLPLLISLVFVLSCATQLLAPARNRLVVQLVPEGVLGEANSADYLSDSVARLAVPAAGGLVLAWGGLSAAVAVDAVTFVLAALLLVPLLRSEHEHAPQPRRSGSLLASLRSGLMAALARGPARAVILIFSIVMVAQGLLNVALVAIAADIGNAGTYGAIIAAQGLGSIAGSFPAPAAIRRWGAGGALAGALTSAGLLVSAYALIGSTSAAAVLSAFIGVAVAVVLISLQTQLQLSVSIDALGRVTSILTATAATSTLVGLLGAGLLAPLTGERSLALLAGPIITLTGLWALRTRLEGAGNGQLDDRAVATADEDGSG